MAKQHCKGVQIEYQSPYKGFNRITAEMIEAGVTGYQSPYKGFNRTR